MQKPDDNQKSYHGYPLFPEAEGELKAHNRAAVMANITEDYQENNRVSRQGMGLLLGYFGKIPAMERQDVLTAYRTELTARGVSYAH